MVRLLSPRRKCRKRGGATTQTLLKSQHDYKCGFTSERRFFFVAFTPDHDGSGSLPKVLLVSGTEQEHTGLSGVVNEWQRNKTYLRIGSYATSAVW